ncbi:MAG: type II secretion system protein M [Aquabacterium sp.]|uniref:type II secretion system protein GspM n=1 Tax=Aquabacterium sp. TaxID=1872578 RepID=UPI00121D0EF8|nr:type II secretion system protein GspM [Aquabacterium sp.]TAK94288.1 MAG: type II secretion system protein M [Aquabacterium sp.]
MANQSSSFQALKQEWQTKWAAMAPRERQITLVAAWLAGLTLLIMVGVRPAWRTLSDAPAQLRDLDGQLDQMRRLADETQMLKQRPPVPPAQSEAALKSATDRLGAGAKLVIQGDRATLTLNKVSGDALASWLDEARGAARAKPTEAGLMQVEPGVYSGNIVLALGPGSGGGR